MIPSYQTPFIKLTTGAASPKHNKNAPNFFSSNVTSLIYRSQFRSSASESFTSPRGSRNHPGLDGIRANQTSRMRLEAAGGKGQRATAAFPNPNISCERSRLFNWGGGSGVVHEVSFLENFLLFVRKVIFCWRRRKAWNTADLHIFFLARTFFRVFCSR